MLIFLAETLDLMEVDIKRVYINQPVEVYVDALGVMMPVNVSLSRPVIDQLNSEPLLN